MSQDVACRRQSARSPLFMLVETDQEMLWAIDMGLGGIKCQAKSYAEVGRFMDLRFRLPGDSRHLKVGGQVTGFDRCEKGTVTLNMRFCRFGNSDQLALYRFMDRRRSLWDRSSAAEASPAPHKATRPFEALILEAQAAINLNLNQPRSFIRANRVGLTRTL